MEVSSLLGTNFPFVQSSKIVLYICINLKHKDMELNSHEKRSAKAQLALQELQNASAKSGKEWTDKDIDNLIREYRRGKK